MVEAYAGDAEALPHVHKGHYFNVMNVFGLGGGKCEYSLANSTADTSFYSPVKPPNRDRKGIPHVHKGHYFNVMNVFYRTLKQRSNISLRFIYFKGIRNVTPKIFIQNDFLSCCSFQQFQLRE